jgi:hypothetical protein
MNHSPLLYSQLLTYLRQYSRALDLRHLKALAWMVYGLLCSGKISLSAWEPYVISRATQSQSYERRWNRYLKNPRISVERLYLPLVMLALKGWQSHRLYVAIDTTVLWDKYCMIHLSVVCCGRAVPLMWKVLEHESATVSFEAYQGLLRKARWILRGHPDIMLLADRAFASHDLLKWLDQSTWHYALRLKCDVMVHGPNQRPLTVGQLYPPLNEARCYSNVGLWADGKQKTNLVVATVKGAKDSWAVITDEKPSIETLWEYGLRFQVEELFLDSKSGAFQLEDSRLRSVVALERLYLVVAVALLYATTQGMAVQLAGLRTQVDPHWRRGISYLKIGLRYLQGVIHKGRKLLEPHLLLPEDPEPCFASKQAEYGFNNAIWFTRIRTFSCEI